MYLRILSQYCLHYEQGNVLNAIVRDKMSLTAQWGLRLRHLNVLNVAGITFKTFK